MEEINAGEEGATDPSRRGADCYSSALLLYASLPSSAHIQTLPRPKYLLEEATHKTPDEVVLISRLIALLSAYGGFTASAMIRFFKLSFLMLLLRFLCFLAVAMVCNGAVVFVPRVFVG